MMRSMVAGALLVCTVREDEHAEARELERELHGLVGAKLADQDHVRVLAAGAADGVGEARGVLRPPRGG